EALEASALEVLAGQRHDVDHTRERVLAVERRPGTLDHLQPLHVLEDEEVEAGVLGEAALVPVVVRRPVDQQQHAVRERVLAEAAHVDGLDHRVPADVHAGDETEEVRDRARARLADLAGGADGGGAGGTGRGGVRGGGRAAWERGMAFGGPPRFSTSSARKSGPSPTTADAGAGEGEGAGCCASAARPSASRPRAAAAARPSAVRAVK